MSWQDVDKIPLQGLSGAVCSLQDCLKGLCPPRQSPVVRSISAISSPGVGLALQLCLEQTGLILPVMHGKHYDCV